MNARNLLCIALIASSTAACGAEQASIVAPLLDQTAIRGCSWNAAAPALGGGFIFLAEYDDSEILMNLDGVDTRLELVSDSGSLRLGDVRERRYRAENVEVLARYTATQVCPAGAEGCEVTGYDVTFDVKKEGRTELVEASGEVGC